jgi:hypothetical protein
MEFTPDLARLGCVEYCVTPQLVTAVRIPLKTTSSRARVNVYIGIGYGAPPDGMTLAQAELLTAEAARFVVEALAEYRRNRGL